MGNPKAFTHPRQSFSCGLYKKSIEIVSFFKMYQIDVHQPLTVVLGYERTLIIKTSFRIKKALSLLTSHDQIPVQASNRIEKWPLA